jgi:transcriptional regulator with XRE-family HTH domain
MNVSLELKNFCRNVAYLRKKHSLTQAEMAKIMNVGVGTIRSLERGIVPPRLSADVLYSLHDHFHISVDALFSSWAR